MDVTVSCDPFAPEPESVDGPLDARYHQDFTGAEQHILDDHEATPPVAEDDASDPDAGPVIPDEPAGSEAQGAPELQGVEHPADGVEREVTIQAADIPEGESVAGFEPDPTPPAESTEEAPDAVPGE